MIEFTILTGDVMKLPPVLALVATVVGICTSIMFAQAQTASPLAQTAVGPSGNIPLTPVGVANGVAMSQSGTTGTLQVGTLGGPAMHIFTSNVALTSPFLAVSTGASSQGSIQFNSSSTVFGTIGVTPPGGPFLLNISGGNTGTVVNFQGPVYATTTFVTGAGTMNFQTYGITTR